MKNVMGGNEPLSGDCASINAGGEVMYNLSRAEAQAVGAGGHWCCDSCATASWYCPYGEFC